jgi:hypothetical protein
MTSRLTPIATAAVGALALTLAGTRFTMHPLDLARLAILGAALGPLTLYDLR